MILFVSEIGYRLFGSVVRALDFYPCKPGSNPTIAGFFFSYASFLCYDFVVRFDTENYCDIVFYRVWL